MQKFRHEKKYVCSQRQMIILEKKLKVLMKLDPYAIGGSYEIRSIYFDDYKNTCFYENEEGADPRQKYRIRTYGGNANEAKLELKQKIGGMTRKLSCSLSREQVELILNGNLPAIENHMPELLKYFVIDCKKKRLEPKVIVSYTRIPYIYSVGNVRITLDYNLVSSNRVDLFFNNRMMGRPIMSKYQQVLEVKYDELLPDVILQVLQTQHLQQTSYSKYYLCRKYNMGSIRMTN